MLTVLHLLSHQMFHNFKLISDTSGLHNSVTGTGIWDWESKEDMEASFYPGEFILTTLPDIKDREGTVEDYIKLLVDRNVAAIAIKNVHKRAISHSTIDYANQRHVPIFLFADIFIDDLIYTIKDALITKDSNSWRIMKLREVLEGQSHADVRRLANELNPFFREHFICCCGVPKAKENQEKRIDGYYDFYNQLVNTQKNPENARHLLVKGKKCFFLIYSSTSDVSALKSELLHLMADLEISEKDFRLGISQPKGELALLHQGLWEAVYSAVTCTIGNETILDYGNIGINQFLMPVSDSDWVKNFYFKYHQRLEAHDRQHNANLHTTLV